jgi:16S rRNA G966 N2-methylase RsmD
MCIICVHTPKCNCLNLCVEQHQYYALLAWHTSHYFTLLDKIYVDPPFSHDALHKLFVSAAVQVQLSLRQPYFEARASKVTNGGVQMK